MSKREFIHGFQKMQHPFRLPHQEGRLTCAFASPKREILLFKTLLFQVSRGGHPVGIVILFLLRFPVPTVAVTLSWQHWRVETFWSRTLYPIPNKQTQVQRGTATCSRSLYDIGKARSLWSGSLVDAQPFTWMKVFWTSPLPSLKSSPDFFSFILTGCS